MWYGVGIIGLIIWIAIAFWPARVAGRKGHSFIGYFILSLVFFPLALIMAYVVRDRRIPVWARAITRSRSARVDRGLPVGQGARSRCRSRAGSADYARRASSPV